MIDQASGLRKMQGLQKIKVIAVSGGKGGVGKTNVSLNTSIALAQLGKRVLVLDADLGLANVDVMLVSLTILLSKGLQELKLFQQPQERNRWLI